MKNNRNIVLVICVSLLALVTACSTDYSRITDSGTSNGKHACSMYEYMAQDSVVHLDSLGQYIKPMSNWGLTLQMIHRGGLDSLFQGLDVNTPQITFIAPTSYSIMTYLFAQYGNFDPWRHPYVDPVDVSMIDSVTCRRMMLSCVISGRFMRAENIQASTNAEAIPVGDYSAGSTGGKVYPSLYGTDIWLSTFQGGYNGQTNVGAWEIHGVFRATGSQFEVASGDIETLTGIVHSLPNNFLMNNL